MESNFYYRLPDGQPDESAGAFPVDRIWEMRATLCAQVFYPTRKRASLPQSHVCTEMYTSDREVYCSALSHPCLSRRNPPTTLHPSLCRRTFIHRALASSRGSCGEQGRGAEGFHFLSSPPATSHAYLHRRLPPASSPSTCVVAFHLRRRLPPASPPSTCAGALNSSKGLRPSGGS